MEVVVGEIVRERVSAGRKWRVENAGVWLPERGEWLVGEWGEIARETTGLGEDWFLGTERRVRREEGAFPTTTRNKQTDRRRWTHLPLEKAEGRFCLISPGMRKVMVLV